MKKEEFIKNINFWNWKAYRDNYPDLNNKSEGFLLKHILNHGIKENRNIIMNKDMNGISKKTIEKNFDLLLPKDFVWNEYINLHSDLKNMNEKQAKIHYIMHGNYEGRSYICNKNTRQIALSNNTYNNKIIILNQTGGFFNRIRLINNVNFLQKNNYLVYILDQENIECNCKMFDYINNDNNYKIIHNLNEINDFDDNYIYINEFKYNNLNLKNIENFKIFNNYKQKYIYLESGLILNQGMINSHINYKIKLENNDFKIIQNLKKYNNIFMLRCSPPEWDKFKYLSTKISYLNINTSFISACKYRNFYRIDLNSKLLNYIKSFDNSVLLLDYVNDDIKKKINDNNLNYLDIYSVNNRNDSGIINIIKKYLAINDILKEKKVHCSLYSSISERLSSNNLSMIRVTDIYSTINIKIEGIDDIYLNNFLESNKKYISNSNLEYDIYLSKNIEKNYDNIFNNISLFNEQINNFSYYIALETYIGINLEINPNIIKLNDDWQHPIATEYYTYLQLRYININKYKYVAMPWATIIDNWTHNKKIDRKEFPNTSIFEDDLNCIKRMKLDNGVTVIQHILYEKMIPCFKELGIKYVFASHCLKETEYDGIKIFPYFLYNYIYNLDCSINRKKLLNNAIYGVGTNKDRNDLISKLNKSKYINIKTNNSWFFQDLVYNLQIRNTYTDTLSFYIENKEYFKFINESSFQICLAGSGKNTIRLFECINLKIVPVIDFDIHINCSIFNLENYVIKINMNDLIEHLKLQDLDTFYVNNEKFEDLIEKKKKNIEKDFNNIRTLDLYNNYIKEKLNIT